MRSLLLSSVPVVLILASGCVSPPEAPAEEGTQAVRLALLGQALIEHDPRDHLRSPLLSLQPLLDSADMVFTNLEVAVEGPDCECLPTRTGVYFHSAGPEVLDYLDQLGVSLVSLANNHSWDLGPGGILSTIHEAEARGLVHAGTGRDISEATAPGYLDLGNTRIALVAMASVNAPPGASATDFVPGVNMLLPGDSSDWDRNLGSVRAASRQADIVLVYHHFQTDADPGWQESWARASIDAGADLYVSHGEPTLAGVESYEGGIILYGLGNFIFNTRTELGRYPAEVWESVVVEISVGASGVEEVEFTPISIDEGSEGPDFLQTRGFPELAVGDHATSILLRLSSLSAAHGTHLDLSGGKARLRLNRDQ
jgi:poly-gamma-glutamate capsule biosynthesis protein CapA/YwtB (metallophosphatase superfamily)